MQQTFSVSNEQINSILTGVAMVIAVSAYLAYEHKFCAALLIFSLALVIGAWSIRKLSRCAISLDETGIWYSKQGKSASFVAWQTITDTKRSIWSGDLVLMDTKQRAMISLNPALENAAALLDILIEKTRISQQSTQKTVFTRRHYRLVYLGMGFLTVFTSLVVYLSGNRGENCHSESTWIIPLIVGIVLMGFLLWSYSINVYQLTINHDHLLLHYAFKQQVIPFSAIEHLSAASFFTIKIVTTLQKQPLYIGTFDSDPALLYYQLRRTTTSPNQHS